MRERVGDGTLEEQLGWTFQRSIGGEVSVEPIEGREQSLDLLVPRQWRGIVPLLFASGDREGPIEQIADVGQDLGRSAGLFGGVIVGKFGLGTAHSFAAAIGQRGNGMAEKVALRVGGHRPLN
jgi:hypothetical protein